MSIIRIFGKIENSINTHVSCFRGKTVVSRFRNTSRNIAVAPEFRIFVNFELESSANSQEI